MRMNNKGGIKKVNKLPENKSSFQLKLYRLFVTVWHYASDMDSLTMQVIAM